MFNQPPAHRQHVSVQHTPPRVEHEAKEGRVDARHIYRNIPFNRFLICPIVAAFQRNLERFAKNGPSKNAIKKNRDCSRERPADPRGAQPRNAPCACGSGKKFKKCHGAAGGPVATPEEVAAPPATPTCSNAGHKFSHCDCAVPTPIVEPAAA